MILSCHFLQIHDSSVVTIVLSLIITKHIKFCNMLRAAERLLTLWRPLLPYGYSYKASCGRPGRAKSAVICNFWHPDTLTLMAELTVSVCVQVRAQRAWQRWLLYSSASSSSSSSSSQQLYPYASSENNRWGTHHANLRWLTCLTCIRSTRASNTVCTSAEPLKAFVHSENC